MMRNPPENWRKTRRLGYTGLVSIYIRFSVSSLCKNYVFLCFKVKLCEEQLDIQDTEDVSSVDSKSTIITRLIYLLYFLLWITLYAIALEYEFGAVYFVLSALVFICLNTRSGPKRRGEPSAYSVFNPNCEAIEGTLDASQFEREIRYGIGGARVI